MYCMETSREDYIEQDRSCNDGAQGAISTGHGQAVGFFWVLSSAAAAAGRGIVVSRSWTGCDRRPWVTAWRRGGGARFRAQLIAVSRPRANGHRWPRIVGGTLGRSHPAVLRARSWSDRWPRIGISPWLRRRQLIGK